MISILLTYFNRPILVRKALESVLAANEHYKDWRLLVGDDNSPIPAEPIAREILKDHLDKVDFIRSTTSIEEKLLKGTSIGKFANEYIMTSNSDVIVTLCDDDKLHEQYLAKLAAFYQTNKSIMYAYSDIWLYNPIINMDECRENHYNRDIGEANPSGLLDASQVSFRADCVRVYGIRFPEYTAIGNMPYLNNVDAQFYNQLYDRFGKINRTGFVGQYKGIHDYQLVWHKKQGSSGVGHYIDMVKELGGKLF